MIWSATTMAEETDKAEPKDAEKAPKTEQGAAPDKGVAPKAASPSAAKDEDDLDPDDKDEDEASEDKDSDEDDASSDDNDSDEDDSDEDDSDEDEASDEDDEEASDDEDEAPVAASERAEKPASIPKDVAARGSVVQVRAVTPPPPAASLGKSVSAFFFIMIGLAAGFWFLSTMESPFSKQGQPKWKVGQTVAIVLTLDPRDDDNLACASDANIAGKRCEFESKTERAQGKLEDANMLKPYKTTSDEPLLAAGVWGFPEVAKGKRPNGRFNFKCQFKVEGKVKRPAVRWNVTAAFGDQEVDWFAGTVSNCTVEK